MTTPTPQPSGSTSRSPATCPTSAGAPACGAITVVRPSKGPGDHA